MIPPNSDLDAYTTPGTYYNPSSVDVKTMKNLPITIEFKLVVEYQFGTIGTYIMQTFIDYITMIKYCRRSYDSGTTWQSWYKMNTPQAPMTENRKYLGLVNTTSTLDVDVPYTNNWFALIGNCSYSFAAFLYIAIYGENTSDIQLIEIKGSSYFNVTASGNKIKIVSGDAIASVFASLI